MELTDEMREWAAVRAEKIAAYSKREFIKDELEEYARCVLRDAELGVPKQVFDKLHYFVYSLLYDGMPAGLLEKKLEETVNITDRNFDRMSAKKILLSTTGPATSSTSW